MSLKSEVTCNICKLVLKDPVTLPCSSSICVEHLRDGTTKDGIIKCLKCGKDFGNGFLTNESLNNILAKEFHLTEEEKTIRLAIQDLTRQLNNYNRM